MESQIVVVGAGLAGARVCQQLRRQGYRGGITLLGAEPHPPYDRPPLTKAVLSGARDETTLPVDFGELEVTVRLGCRAVALDVAGRTVDTTGGVFAHDGIVLATGADPIRLPGPGEQHAMRTLDDAWRVRDRLTAGSKVVVVGASWIGAEVATAALARGCEVTCVEAASTVSSAALGAAGDLLLPWWQEVDLLLDTAVERVEDGAVHVASGMELPADLVVVGVGVRPATAWLESSGLGLDRGVVVDEWLRAAPGVVAIGDVARWRSRRYGRHLQVEHWDNAAGAAAVAAASLLEPEDGAAGAYDPVPYFWSDQFGHKLQYVGAHGPGDRTVHRVDPDGAGWSLTWVDDGGSVSAVLLADRPREIVTARKLTEGRVVSSREALIDPDVPLGALVA